MNAFHSEGVCMRLLNFAGAQLIFFTSFLSPLNAQAQSASQWIPGQCGEDGQCSLISISLEVEGNKPSHDGGILVGSIDDDGFKPAMRQGSSVKKRCRKEVRVPRVVYDAVTQMFRGIVARGNGVSLQPTFTPAEQTMLLYYNTIMQQTMNFQCNN